MEINLFSVKGRFFFFLERGRLSVILYMVIFWEIGTVGVRSRSSEIEISGVESEGLGMKSDYFIYGPLIGVGPRHGHPLPTRRVGFVYRHESITNIQNFST